MDAKTISSLAKNFNETGIYSQNRYRSGDCPLQVFKKLYPNDIYTYQIETFLNLQPEFHEGNGADLPWWGNRYFTDEKGIRIMILSQDSRTPNGGSVTFYMPLLKQNKKLSELRSIINSNSSWDKFVSFEKAKKFFDKCKFDYDFVYVTDAKKTSNRWEILLEKEIQIVNPDIILCLGNIGLSYLLRTKNPQVTKIVDQEDTSLEVHPNSWVSMSKNPIIIASLFPSKGNGHYTIEREKNVINTLHKVVRKLEGAI